MRTAARARARVGPARRAQRPLSARRARRSRRARASRRRDRRAGSERDPVAALRQNERMKLALAQINPIVGDLDGNRALILERMDDAKRLGADLVVFPELAVTGYPPEDLLLRPGFIRAAEESLETIARSARGIVAVRGSPRSDRARYHVS